MAIELRAVLSLEDRISKQMKRATQSVTDFGRRVNEQSKQLTGLKTQILGVAGAYASARAGAKLFNSTIGEAAKFEASSIAVEAIFNDKKLSDSYMKMVDKMAIDSPLLNSTDMLKNSKGLVAMTKNMDDLKKSWKIVEKLQVLDPTQGTDGATFALKEMFQGDNLSMTDRFGLNKKELNRIKKLSIPKQVAELNKLLDGMGVTEAAIERMGSTTLGYWAQIGERADKFKRTIGAMGNSKIGEVLGGIVGKLDSIDLDAIAAKVDAVIGNGVQKIIDFGKKVWELRAPILAVAKVVGTFVGVVAGIVGVITVIGAIGKTIAFLASPIGLLALGIIGVSKAFKLAYEKIEPFRNAVDKVVGVFKGLFAILSGNKGGSFNIMLAAGLDLRQIKKVREFTKMVSDAFGKVKAVFSSVSKIFGGEHKGAINVLESAGFTEAQVGLVRSFGYSLKGAFDRVREAFSALKTGDGKGFMEALGFSPAMIDGVTGFVDYLKVKVSDMVTFLASKWEALKPGIAMLVETFVMFKDNLVMIFTTLWSLLEPIFNVLSVAFKIVADVAVMAFSNVIMPVIRNTMAVMQMLWKIVGPILSLLGAAIGAAFEILRIVWDAVIKPFVNFMTTVFKKAFELALPLIEKVGEAFDFVGGIIKQIASWLNDFTSALSSFKVPNWLSKLGGGGTVSFEEKSGSGQTHSRYNGIDYVPYNGYQITAHKGERLQTAQEVREEKKGGKGGVVVTGNTFHVRQESDIDSIALKLARLIENEGGQLA